MKHTTAWFKTEVDEYINTINVYSVGLFSEDLLPREDECYVLAYMTEEQEVDDSYVLYAGSPEACDKYLEELFDEPPVFYGKGK